jgi:hypothetical protein
MTAARLRRGVLQDDRVLHRRQRGGSPSRCADFVVDVLDEVIGGLRGDEEFVGDLLRHESSRGEAQDINFAAGKPGKILWTASVGDNPKTEFSSL